MEQTLTIVHRRFHVRDGILLTLLTSVALAVCRALDGGLMTLTGLDRVLFDLRVGSYIFALALSVLIVLKKHDRQNSLSRPGRSALLATATAGILFFGTRLPKLFDPDVYGRPITALQFMIAHDLFWEPDSRSFYAILTVLLLGITTRTFKWSIDWIEVAGLGTATLWLATGMFELVYFYSE